MPQFVLVLRDSGKMFSEGLGAEEIQAIIGRYSAWRKKVNASGQKLMDGEGKLVRKNGNLGVTDGPYTEGREVIGGFFIIEASDYDNALHLIEDCPHLDYGSIEVRQIQPMPAR